MAEIKNEIFREIEYYYSKLMNESNAIEDRFVSARTIVDTIRNYYKDQEAINDQFHNLRSERIHINELRNKKNPHSRKLWVHENTVKGWMDFLVEKKHIPKRLLYSFESISKKSNPYAHGRKGNDEDIVYVKPMCADIIQWFFTLYGRDTSFLGLAKGNDRNNLIAYLGIIIFLVGFLLVFQFESKKWINDPADTIVNYTDSVTLQAEDVITKHEENPTTQLNDSDCCVELYSHIIDIQQTFQDKNVLNITDIELQNGLSKLKRLQSSCKDKQCDLEKRYNGLYVALFNLSIELGDLELLYFNYEGESPKSEDVIELEKKIFATYELLSYLCPIVVNCSQEQHANFKTLIKQYTK